MKHGVAAVISASVVSLGCLVGCATVSPRSGFGDVQALASERIPQRLHWRSGLPEDEEVARQVAELLAAPLNVSSAIQIALLENPELQATYEELGISQAHLVQAGLLRNPVFFASSRFPDRSPSRVNVEFAVAQDFLDILTRSARVNIAEAELERTKLRVADAIVSLAAEVGVAYYETLGAKQVAAMRELTAEAAHASAELARRIHAAGNLSDRRLAIEQSMYESTRVEWAKAEAQVLAAREELTKRMGLWGQGTNWTLMSQLPPLPEEEPSLAELESLAMGRRLDLAAAKRAADIAAAALGLTRDWRYLAVLDVGVSSERDTDGQVVTGPDLTIELPVFDRRQAVVATLESQLRQHDLRVEAMAIAIRSDVRALRNRLLAARNLLKHYRDVIVPLREEVVQLTQEEFNYMLIGAFELILAKREEYDAYQGYLETLTEYWKTRTELERAIGGAFSHGNSDRPPPNTQEQPPHHDNHGG